VVENAGQAVLEIGFIRRADAVTYPGHLSEERGLFRVDRHGVLDGPGADVRLVLFVEPLQHYGPAHVNRDRRIRVERVLR
jgi:hypothetical protein